ncbi:MAG: hypothetical protein BGO68_02340 [Candidatus Amoebophilus sp. 36-38]|nr:MAG: hypothetical protein BGO68_02340 [Candidatus Amoebophilus sp. 36-38]
MKRNYNLSHRLITCILLTSLFLQSCNNFPKTREQVNNTQLGSIDYLENESSKNIAIRCTEKKIENKNSTKRVLHQLAQVTYIPGQFQYDIEEKADKNKIELYAPPYRPAKMPEQNTQTCNETLQIPHYEQRQQETVLRRVKKGQDGRSRIQKTTDWPYRLIGQLKLCFSDGEYGGSGVMVGPQHILTCAHNIYRKEWAHKVVVRLGLNDDLAPYGESLATRIYTFKRWIKQKDKSYDLALLVLAKPIGMQTGWFGLLAALDKDLQKHKVNITGYPGDKGFKQMWTMCHGLQNLFEEQITYEIDTYGGQSGSAIWLNKWGSPYVVGIHTRGGNFMSSNSGVRISYAKARKLVRWIGETLTLKERVNYLPTNVLSYETVGRLFKKTREGNSKALMKLLNASHSNHAHAQYLLAMLYEYGWGGLTKNIKKAGNFYNKAAKQGHLEAQSHLGWVSSNYLFGRGNEMVKDKIQALKWLKIAASQGDLSLQFNLGSIYYNGFGVARDYIEAAYWIQKAAVQGNVHMQNYLGWMYQHGLGVKQDYTQAREWYQRAVDQRDQLCKIQLWWIKIMLWWIFILQAIFSI